MGWMTMRQGAALGLVLCLTAGDASAAGYASLDPVRAGMGGAGIALTGRFAPLANPAQLALTDQRADIQLTLPFGAWGRSPRDVLRRPLADFQSAAAIFEAAGSSQTRDAALEARAALDGAWEQRGFHAGGILALPNLPLSVGAYTYGRYLETQGVELGGQADLSDPNNPDYDARLVKRAFSVVETGALMAKVLRQGSAGGANRLAVGLAPKLRLVRTYYGAVAARGADPGDVGHQVADDGAVNLDIGVVQEFAYVWKAALVARNVVPQTVAWADPAGNELALGPQVRAGLGYRGSQWRLAADLDVTANGAVGFEGRSRQLSLGAAYRAGGGFWLRGGVFQDLIGEQATGAALGLGLMRRWLAVDVAVSYQAELVMGFGQAIWRF